MDGQCWRVADGLRPAMAMVLVQIVYAAVNILYKLCINEGMSLRVLIAYRFIFAALVLSPFAFFLERKRRPKLSWMILFQSFLSGLVGGCLAQNLYVMGMELTSATFATAMANITPAITFILAVAFRMEKMAIGTLPGKAKVFGTLLGIGGAMTLTLYKGIDIKPWSTHLIHSHTNPTTRMAVSHVSTRNHILGALLVVGHCLSFAAWLILQAKMSVNYPCQFSLTTMMCIMAAIQSTIFALCTERDWTQWKLGWNIRLLTVSFSGIVASGFIVSLVAWCIRIRGPVFASMFTPLLLVMVALAGFLVLDEKLYLGSIIGATLIIIGLYVVLWGKSKEMKKMSQLMPAKNSEASTEGKDYVITSMQHE